MDSEAIVCSLAPLPSSGNKFPWQVQYNTLNTLSEACSPVDKFDKLVNFAVLLIPVFLCPLTHKTGRCAPTPHVSI